MALGAIFLLAGGVAAFSPPAQAQSPISAADSKKPIDIESDQLEVDDKMRMATFSGNVSATQGDANLKAQRLEVFYDAAGQGADKGGQASKTAPAKTGSAAGNPVASNRIKRIHATGGRVVVTNARDQQEVTGDDAVYDVRAQKITMTGKEVVLSQGLSKAKGTKLVIDLKTGRATFNDELEQSAAGEQHRPRIKAVFQAEMGPDGKPVVPGLTGSKAATPASVKKKPASAASRPARQPAKPDADEPPARASDWQTQSR